MATTTNWKEPLHQIRRSLAKIWLNFFPNLTIIGITGSYGKTNTARAIAVVLAQRYRVLQTNLNLDTVYNLPITIFKLRPGTQKLVLEYGVDHQNEMDFHLSLVKPSIAVVTGINPTHSEPELLGSVEGIIKEKGKLIQFLPPGGWAVLNWDDEKVKQMAKMAQAKIIKYGTTSGCDYWADDIRIDFSGTRFTLHWQKEEYPMVTGLVGQHFVTVCLAAIVVGRLQNLSWLEIKSGLKELKPLKGRLSIEKGPQGSILINDALRANPASTLAGLKVLSNLPTKGKRIAVLGEMGELGASAESEHRRIGQEIAKSKIDYLISIGPLQKLTAQEAVKNGMKKERVFWVVNINKAAEILKGILNQGDLFYLKGSLLKHLERVLIILNRGQVGCKVTSCHNYNQCNSCPNLQKAS